MILDARALAFPGRIRPTDLSMAQPQLVCIIGPNGSGKTSLLHAIAGIGRPSGDVLIAGEELRLMSPDRRKRKLAYLPANREALWPVTARDLIALGLPRGGSADEAIESLGLATLADRRIDRLSTGERSRVLIARALAPRPALLLLDEPIANLDPAWQLRLMDVLAACVKAGQGVLVALHDLDLAARYADRLIVMCGGAIVAGAPPNDILAGERICEVFGVRRSSAGWSLVNPPADPRSSR